MKSAVKFQEGRWVVALWTTFFLFLLAILPQTAGQARADIALQTVVERNDPAPGGGEFLSFGSPAINGSGEIALRRGCREPGLFRRLAGAVGRLRAAARQGCDARGARRRDD